MLNSVFGTLSSGVAASTSSYESIATATGTGSSTTITFSSIPSTYKHLQLRWNARTTSASAAFAESQITFNGVGGTSYAFHYIEGTGATASSAASASSGFISLYASIAGGGLTSGIMGVGILDILDYGSTTKNKTIKTLHGGDMNGTSGRLHLTSGLLVNTSAISSISIVSQDSNFATSTTYALYGIKG